MKRQEVILGIDVVLAVMRRDYRNDDATLDRLEEELKSYYESCFAADIAKRKNVL